MLFFCAFYSNIMQKLFSALVILEQFLKDHVTLKPGEVMLKIQFSYHWNK